MREELVALGRSAGIPEDDFKVTRDETGLAFLIDVRQRGAALQD
ncbi:MAG: hypothetical protein ABI837_18260 [Acidobacteriota bacterium]